MANMYQFLSSIISIFSLFEFTYSLPTQQYFEVQTPDTYKRKLDYSTKTLPKCWVNVKPVFTLWSRTLAEEGPSHLVILIHGFNSWPSVWAEELAELILTKDTRKALQVLTVDWSQGSSWDNIFSVWSDYSRAVANTRCLAEITATLISTISTSSIHCLGHSLGAHTCGFISNKLEKATGGKMERITGLDPAGIDWTTVRVGIMQIQPMPVLPHRDERLDSSDAILVDVIHSDGNFAGSMTPMGDVDFYVGRNEEALGSSQKDCGCTDNCDHARSFKLMIESMQRQVEVTKMLRCQEPKEFTLSGCQPIDEGDVQMFGYFYTKQEPTGAEKNDLIGLLIESDAEEQPCVEDEDDWSDDDWSDDDYEEDKDWQEIIDDAVMINEKSIENTVMISDKSFGEKGDSISINQVQPIFANIATDFFTDTPLPQDKIESSIYSKLSPINSSSLNTDTMTTNNSNCGSVCIISISILSGTTICMIVFICIYVQRSRFQSLKEIC